MEEAEKERIEWQGVMKEIMVLQGQQKDLSERTDKLWEKVDAKLNQKENGK